MDTLIIILLLLILVELTYILSKTPRIIGGRVRAGRPIFVDTSVLIDGRIMAVAQSGFISDTLMIPRSVIGELQFLADNADSEKRARARHGLDVVKELQALDMVTVEIFQDGSRAEEGVDERLLKLAKQHGGAVCTIDYNLNKVAQVENITVLNVNDLAMTLRMAYLPGEKLMLALTSKGNDNTQAVGHLEDGTMVVVEQGKSKIGSVVEVEIIRSLQTAAGKMMFARLAESVKQPSSPRAPKASSGSGRREVITTPESKSIRPVVQPQKIKQPEKQTSQKVTRQKNTPVAQQNQSAAQRQTPPKQQYTQTPKPATRSRQPKRRDNESRLIELVNSQE